MYARRTLIPRVGRQPVRPEPWRSSMMRTMGITFLLGVALIASMVSAPVPASAAVGSVLRTLTPQPTGNGRAVAHDPATGRIFYTNAGDPHIYVIRPDGSWVATLNPIGPDGPVVYGALAWQSTSTGGILWGGRFDGSG